MIFSPDKLNRRGDGEIGGPEEGSAAGRRMLNANSPGSSCFSLAGAHPLDTGRPRGLVMVRALKDDTARHRCLLAARDPPWLGDKRVPGQILESKHPVRLRRHSSKAKGCDLHPPLLRRMLLRQPRAPKSSQRLWERGAGRGRLGFGDAFAK